MLISKKLETTINQQIGNEFAASMQYIHIASYFETEDLLHFAQLFFDQADEERMHAMKFVRYILDTGGEVAIPALPESRHDFKNAEEAVGAALEWEIEVTGQVNALMDIAVEEKDYIAQEFLGWFVTEQLEEVSKMSTILKIVRRAGEDLLMAETYIMSALPSEADAAAA
ncbi:MAG: ferritin [Chloroflexi bacterium]|nr:ferritin [Chloroflexota bacterium]